MKSLFHKRPVAIAAFAAIAASTLAAVPTAATAAGKIAGKYVAGDFHNHTTCSDGSISMQKLVKKSTAVWGLDWFVQAGHGGNGNRNCTLAEDADLATPAYPYDAAKGPTTTWAASIGAAAVKGNIGGTTTPLSSQTSPSMWRWQSIQEFQYPLLEYLSANKNVPLFMGMESVVAGHEHTSMSVITGQMPKAVDTVNTNVSSYTAIGNANALAQWSYCFDRGDTDTSRGAANSWNCAVAGVTDTSANNANWSTVASKLTNNSGLAGHNKTVEAVQWMAANHGAGSYYVPAHLERAGPFNTAGSNGFNIEHLRNLNNAAPAVAFGFESQPGHGASDGRGEYYPVRNNFGAAGNFTNAITGEKQSVDSVGGTTYGGTGVYAAQVGGVWDALLGEGRNWWFFASSDWHNRGQFSADDRRSSQDFQPGEYQRTNVLARTGSDIKIRPQHVVDALRTGNAWSASGQLIDRLAFVACVSTPGIAARTNAQVEAIALNAAAGNTDIDVAGCATMGEKLKVRAGSEVVVSIVLRDPEGTNNSPYTFANPSLAQINISQPLNQPALHHVDLIRGMVSGYKAPGAADYSGEWPRNTDWLRADGTTAGLAAVPAAAKNLSAGVLKTFSAANGGWTVVNSPVDNSKFLKMTLRLTGLQASQYLRLRGTNLPPSTPNETDANGNPLSDVFTNAIDTTMLRIPCTVAHSANSQFDGCPDHLAAATSGTNRAKLAIVNPIAGKKAVSFDIAAWSDLWFYSNPIYVEVAGSTAVAGVK